MTDIDFYFDPGCPWTWITSRWVAEVAPQRQLNVVWKTYSLKIRNENNDVPEQYRAPMEAGFGALRIIEAARAAHGNGAAGDLYREFGALIHHDGDRMLEGLAGAVAAAGLPDGLLAAADDPTWDATIRASTEAGVALVGEDVGVPIIDFLDGAPVYFGPVMSPAPTGAAALELFDAYRSVRRAGMFEIKRSRNVGPEFGPRPVSA